MWQDPSKVHQPVHIHIPDPEVRVLFLFFCRLPKSSLAVQKLSHGPTLTSRPAIMIQHHYVFRFPL